MACHLTPEQIKANRNNPEKLLKIVLTLTEAIELDEQKQQKMRQLRWEFTRQLHNKMPIFWLEGIKDQRLVKIFANWCKEYEIVFGKQSSFTCGNPFFVEAEDWKVSQKFHYEEAQKK